MSSLPLPGPAIRQAVTRFRFDTSQSETNNLKNKIQNGRNSPTESLKDTLKFNLLKYIEANRNGNIILEEPSTSSGKFLN